MSYDDMLVRVDWNDRISAEENAMRSQKLVDELNSYVSHSTIMSGIQQFLLSDSNTNGIAESTIYIKCASSDAVEEVKLRVKIYLGHKHPAAAYSFEASGNIFYLFFSE